MTDAKKTAEANLSCCAVNERCTPKVNRRQVLKGLGASMAGAFSMPVIAGPFSEVSSDSSVMSEGPIPIDKKLDKDWVKSLYARGTPTSYKGWQQLQYIGMPISGIGTGTVYIGGDGKLWVWDIFNEQHEGVVPQVYNHPTLRNEHGDSKIKERNGANYISPPAQTSPWHFEQGFAVVIEQGKQRVRRTLDHKGFDDISFKGQAPIADISYYDAATKLSVALEAMTPYIPLDTDRSSFPATIMQYRLKNNDRNDITLNVEGWSANPVLQGKASIYNASLINTEYADVHGVGFIAQCKGDTSTAQNEIEKLADFGSFAMHCLDPKAQVTTSKSTDNNTALTKIVSQITLAPGESKDVTFIVSWYFPNQKALFKKEHKNIKRWYASKYNDAKQVSQAVASSIAELTDLTKLWRDTWYDSTLPHWLLERAIIPTNALQTNTAYRFDNNRFWAWEGVGCCAGTCTHVWHYAQSVGRLFPDLERDLRERTDYNIGFKDNGAILFRGEYNDKDATDGQAGVILRTYREHQMSPDSAFLNRVWPKAKKALQYLILVDAQGGMPDGIPEG